MVDLKRMVCVAALVFAEMSGAFAADIVDVITFGDRVSEQKHKLDEDDTRVICGGMDEPARQLLPLDPVSYNGGSLEFKMEVDPERQNYVTVRLWGSDRGEELGKLMLYVNGKQAGYRRESDYEPLNQVDNDGQAPGRFVYETRLLPLSMTKGKKMVSLKIAALGRIYRYGDTWEKYQKPFEQPSRGIYRVYTHTNPRFVPPAAEKQGAMPEGRLPDGPGPEVIEQSRQIVIDRLNKILESGPDGGSRNLELLAEAYHVEWTPAYKNSKALELAVQEADNVARRFADDPGYNGGWMGAYPMGRAIVHLWPDIEAYLDMPFDGKKSGPSRRVVWSKALRQSIDYWRANRRDFTNQSMLVDAGIYSSNRALLLIDPENALQEEKALRYIREAVGIEPWMGSDVIEGKSDRPSEIYGDHYYLVTRKGLSRELGWVGSYGETILSITRDLVQASGDEKIRQQLAKLQKARLYFRYPVVDDEGRKGMKLSAEIDNRHTHFPQSGMTYSAPESVREHWGMETAAMLPDDPVVVGVAQRYIADGYYYAYIERRLKDDTLGQMRNISDYEKVMALPKVDYAFPMEEGQPDFVFADEEDAVIAIKHGDTRLFINLYFRAENAVNNVAKILEVTPTITRVVSAKSQSIVNGSGETYTRPDCIDWIRGDAGHRTPPESKIHQAWEGEEMPIAKRPEGASQPRHGEWGPFLGKAAFYWLRYGDYLIGLNTTEDQAYSLPTPDGFAQAPDLVTGKIFDLSRPVKVDPLSTVVLWLGN